MKMAYIAIDAETKECYAICSADPEYISDAAKELQQWKKDGAVVKLLPRDRALEQFLKDISEGR